VSDETDPGEELRVLVNDLRDAIRAAHADGMSIREISEVSGLTVDDISDILATT